MKIVICGSIASSLKMIEIASDLKDLGFKTQLPYSAKRIRDGKTTVREFCAIKDSVGDSCFRKQAPTDLIKNYYKEIGNADAVLIVNEDKKSIKNYIGGNTFIEMAFAYVLNKKIYLLNDIPDIGYRDEIVAMSPIVINKKLSEIVEN